MHDWSEYSNPGLQSHENDPIVLLQLAVGSTQIFGVLAHSFISARKKLELHYI